MTAQAHKSATSSCFGGSHRGDPQGGSAWEPSGRRHRNAIYWTHTRNYAHWLPSHSQWLHSRSIARARYQHYTPRKMLLREARRTSSAADGMSLAFATAPCTAAATPGSVTSPAAPLAGTATVPAATTCPPGLASEGALPCDSSGCVLAVVVVPGSPPTVLAAVDTGCSLDGVALPHAA